MRLKKNSLLLKFGLAALVIGAFLLGICLGGRYINEDKGSSISVEDYVNPQGLVLSKYTVIPPDYFIDGETTIHPLTKGVLDKINDGEGYLVSIEMRNLNGDHDLDVFVTMSSAFPSFYHYVFLWNNELNSFVDITPEVNLAHPTNDLRFNVLKGEFCSEYHRGPNALDNQGFSSIDLYKINGYQKLVRESMASDQVGNYGRNNLFCSEKDGWEIVSGT